MGERKVPVCDIFGTLQPKGLKAISMVVTEKYTANGSTTETVLVDYAVAVGERGKARVVRLAIAATKPPKTREAIGDAKQGE